MKKLIVIAAIAAFVIWVICLCVFTVSEKEIAIITRFGRPIRTITEAGPHLKIPGFPEKVNRLDKRIHVFKTRPLQLLLGDKNPIILTCYVCWHISQPLQFFQSVTVPAVAQEKLADMVNAQLGNVLGDYSLSQIINVDPEEVKLAEIENRILTGCSLQAQRQYGLDVVDIGIRRISYPAIVTNAVYNRMKAEREKEAKKYRAEGLEEAAKIEAAADKTSSQIRAEAYKQAEIIKGEGDSESIRIYEEAYGQDPELYRFLDTLKTYKKILGRQTTLILSTDSELFRYLVPLAEEGEKGSQTR